MREGTPGAPRIRVETDGPYHLIGDIAVKNHLGVEIDVAPGARLCRCGASGTKPFCDGSHRSNGFTGEKSPDRLPDLRETHGGIAVDVLDNRSLCAHAGYCTDIVANAFHADSEPFATPNGARADDLIAAARRCPSGALSVAIMERELRDAVDWTRPPEVTVSKDGPYHVRGGIEIVDEDGTPVPRNAGVSPEHCALCRCGNSKNKPFCSGQHWAVNFADPSPPERPTIFEWAGGYPALVDMLRLFYGKYVPEDDLLRPVFQHMSADHPERVGAWLAEVFGGPKVYSEEMGGYSAMIMHHVGRCLTEAQRARWVSLILAAADEVGLSKNPEFRAALTSYLEWGTRLAVENSQTEARPPENMPMPRWDWSTAAGPPWARTSALDKDTEAHEPTILPGPDEAVYFDPHIKSLFRERDRNAMEWAFDLWECQDVAKHAAKILARTADGTMPPDAPWPEAHVDTLRRWIDAGMLESEPA
jgi:CDGSH-type Zn-finger protein